MKKDLKPIMFVGTCSDAGKSIINTAFCRLFLQDGYRPVPFKAQNMSLNSYSTPEGGEIGRAQAVQAEACRLAPHTDMNPLLLKPTNEKSSQVILNGKPAGNMSAREYFGNRDYKEELFSEVSAAFSRLSEMYNPVVLEGAGSISEMNLRDRDITNMRMALQAGAVTFLVADIDRGGVFASVFGSIQLLPPEEKALIKGIIINKFRGDTSLFQDGKHILYELTGVPVVGVIPYFHNIKIEEEDSVALEMKQNSFLAGKINVAIVLLHHLSNFTDFNILEMDARFHPYYTNNPEEIAKADIIILPGSKNTIADLQALHTNGVANAIICAHKEGKKIIGICGGYQMMGLRIEDPEELEGDRTVIPGLGILPQCTIIEKEKITLQHRFRFRHSPVLCDGYEIHMGRTFTIGKAQENPVAILEDGRIDGYYLNDNCWGSYLHGILDNATVLDNLASGLTQENSAPFDYARFKDEQYDKLAEHIRKNVDLEYIYSVLRN